MNDGTTTEWNDEDATSYDPVKIAEIRAREIANEAVASLCGLVLRRLQEDHPTRSMERNAMEDVLDARLSEIFGEALQQFSKEATT